MKRIVVSFICILIVLGAVGAVFAGRNFEPDFPDTYTQAEMADIAGAGGESEYNLLGVYIA